MKKLTIIMLCLLLTAGCMLVSCNGDNGDVSQTASDTSTVSIDGYDPESGRYVADLPDFKWDATNETYSTFKVCVYSNVIETTYFSEDIGYDLYTTTDEVINDAVRERNNLVLEKTGVTVTACPVDRVFTAVQNDIVGGTRLYDAAMPFIDDCVKLAQEGQLLALNDEMFADYIDLSMPWWDQKASEAFSVSDVLFFTTGDITIMNKIDTWAITFNKEMYSTLFPGEDSLYDIVKQGKWTYDKLISMAKTATVDNGDGVWDYKDQWGLSSAYGDPIAYYLAAGQSLCSKNADDLPYLSIGSDASLRLAQDILQEFSVNNSWRIYAQRLGTPNIWVTALDIFGEGRALFRTSVFSAIKKLRNYDNGIEFGIVPMPKGSEEQESYLSPTTGGYGIVIPTSAADPEFSAYMIELIASEAKNTLTPAYYETTLKSRDARDDESEEMLDLIFGNLNYDIGQIYDFGGVASMFYTLASSDRSDIASSLEQIQGTIEAKIEETIENFRD